MLYLENHDHPRIISRYGSETFWKESGKMLAVSYLFQQGTPFIYQGQEIGMLNWKPEDPSAYRDVQTIWNYEHSALNKTPRQRLERLWRSSRDNARTPVQWSDAPYAGFSGTQPWIGVNPNYTWLNVMEQEQDPDSILNFYRKAIALRKSLPVVRYGTYTEHDKASNKLYVYSRDDGNQKLLVVCSFCKEQTVLRVPKGFDMSKAHLVLCNYDDPRKAVLQPYEARVYLWD